MWLPEVSKQQQQQQLTVMDITSTYGYMAEKKRKMNGLSENSQKVTNNNCNGHDTNDSSDSVSSEDNQLLSHRETSSGSSRCSSQDGMSGQNGSLSPDGVSASETKQSSQDGMPSVNGIATQVATPAQGELQLQQDGSGHVQSRKQRTFTPEVSKDTTYWEKRRKNNEAARRSREKRRQYDVAREQNVHHMTAQNQYLVRQVCILKRRLVIPILETVECPSEDSEMIDNDCNVLMKSLGNNCSPNNREISPNIAMHLGFHCASASTPSPASTSFLDIPNQNSINGERHNLFHLSPVDSIPANCSLTNLKSESAPQPSTCLKADAIAKRNIKQEPREEFSNGSYNSHATPRSIENFPSTSEMFETATSGVNMVRDPGDLVMNGRRSYSTSPSSWYSMEPSISGLVTNHHGSLTNGLNLTNHANTSTPSPSSSSSSINYSMSNSNSINQIPVQQVEDEPLQLTVDKRARLDSDNSSEVPDPVEDLQCDRNSQNCLSSPTANSNSHRSARSLPVKLRHKASIPEHTISLTHSLNSTTLISSNAFTSSSVTNINHSKTNGLLQLSDAALSKNGSLPLLKRDVNGKILHQRNGQYKENDSTYVSSGNSFVENRRKNDENPSVEAICKVSSMSMSDSNSNHSNGDIGKDSKYFERRRRNNEAARKCRENRKTIHQIREAKSTYYEIENNSLKVEVAQQRQELSRLQDLLKKKKETGIIPLDLLNNDNVEDTRI